MSSNRWVYLKVARVTRATTKAVEVELEDGEAVWLPFSQLRDRPEVGDEDLEVAVTEWLANEKNLAF